MEAILHAGAIYHETLDGILQEEEDYDSQYDSSQNIAEESSHLVAIPS